MVDAANQFQGCPDLGDPRPLRKVAQGERGTLRIGVECHACYRWLLNAVSPFLAAAPNVEVDVKQGCSSTY